MANRFFFLAGIKSAQYQDSSLNAALAQHNAFVGRRDTEPLGAGLLQRGRTLFHAVAVGIALHDGADGDVIADVLLHDAKIVAQGRQGNFSPVGPRLNARGCQDCCQASIIQVAEDGLREAGIKLETSSCLQVP